VEKRVTKLSRPSSASPRGIGKKEVRRDGTLPAAFSLGRRGQYRSEIGETDRVDVQDDQRIVEDPDRP